MMAAVEDKMGDVVKLDRKAREARRKAEAEKAAKAARPKREPMFNRPSAALVGGLILVAMIVLTVLL